ncbi:type II CRISPR RNA-guided endonuclease Cas9 [Propionivibrio limicola]|uniref:type II CRISPR RNA-guided endonuclease Cas9 n=1 Tax=Propionivibrio limicola TaxID=167645 RepID=UPI001B879CCB|nr:type II CRISPR RNA-guided endonuclease Cas9 [Propionivibrio limicola]
MQHAYTLGLDIGIASVGWCLLGENRLIDLGVRAFDKAETAKEGDPLNLTRRMARLARHRLAQRAWRLKKLTRELKRHGLIEDKRHFQPSNPAEVSPWKLRVEGLDRKLNRDEWARVIYHLCKHRGFHWVSRAEEKQAEGDAKGEGGRVKRGLSGTRRLMEEKSYRSVAEMLLTEFPNAQRNKQGEYTKAISRLLLGEELKTLFSLQRKFGNPYTSAPLEMTILGNGDRKNGLFWRQRPALSGAALLKMLGKCTFEKAEHRAPKASFTAERQVWLTRLNNLRIVCDGVTRPLNAEERAIALPLPYLQASDLTYKQLHSALVKKGLLPESFEFAGLRAAKEGKDPKSEKLIRLPAWQELRNTLKRAGLETEWESLAGAANGGNPHTLDDIARILSIYKEDDEARTELEKLELPNRERMVEALLDIRFDKFHALSLKVLRKIVPFMEQGQRYDEACVSAGYHHSQLHAPDESKFRTLPPLYKGRDSDGRMLFAEDADIPRNPVVLRALNQARKVVNAIARRYGSPMAVNIEMARDLSRPLDERNKIKKEQDEYRTRNERDKTLFIEEFGQEPKGGEFEKFRLYREQLGKCAYSQEAIDLDRLLEAGYVEIDHALPYSRSFDDGKNNKVLVLARENRDKGNRTPYEYLGGAENSPRWQRFVVFVETNKAYRLAKRSRLLRKEFGSKEAEEFKERNLNDTRYICKFFKNHVERYLQLADGSEVKRCVVLSGQMTAFLRARWGINKIRSESDRHHALDAAVIAACSHGMVKRLADYSRTRELHQVRDGFIDTTTGEIINPAKFRQLKQHFPEPWSHFRHELESRLKTDDRMQLRADIERFGTYDDAALDALLPLFVSRAPQRRNGGAAHKDTIYAQPARFQQLGSVTQKVPLASLSLKDIDKLIDPHRNEKLYAAIRERLNAHGGKGEKAFPPDNPLRKPDRDGNPTGPVVRSVTMLIDKLSGIPVRGGIAKNDSMLRVDVFTKAGKFHLVPVYVHHKVTVLPNRAIVQAKDEGEWTLIDETFDWCFSLYPNDLVRVTQKGKQPIIGYYSSCHRGTGNLNIWVHDRNQQVGKDGMLEGIGVKTALALEKLHVDTLGHIYPAQPEPRRGLA